MHSLVSCSPAETHVSISELGADAYTLADSTRRGMTGSLDPLRVSTCHARPEPGFAIRRIYRLADDETQSRQDLEHTEVRANDVQ